MCEVDVYGGGKVSEAALVVRPTVHYFNAERLLVPVLVPQLHCLLDYNNEPKEA